MKVKFICEKRGDSEALKKQKEEIQTDRLIEKAVKVCRSEREIRV